MRKNVACWLLGVAVLFIVAYAYHVAMKDMEDERSATYEDMVATGPKQISEYVYYFYTEPASKYHDEVEVFQKMLARFLSKHQELQMRSMTVEKRYLSGITGYYVTFEKK